MLETLAKWTLDDYHRTIDAGILSDRKVELLNGNIVEKSPEGPIHYFITSDIADYLRSRLGNAAKVRETGPITLSDRSEPEPDIAVVKPLGIVYRDRHPYPEDVFWTIEIAYSSIGRDLGEKVSAYGRAGISEYWVVDLQKLEVIVMRSPSDAGYERCQVFTSGRISPAAFPNLDITIAKLLGG
ncbi:Uma2 family endonuclease [Synechococcus sp. PCC 7336]|uniref:Uma2 family endonuclease n=1 Tax=Synechococcus sp. PCC 7336 TaxID=195250 RepID=UPI00034C19D6|nr:Uma2 family endonuclease [Synechococcus sp. PCC 7336]